MIRLINADADEFYRESQYKKVYCFGSGKYLERYAKESYYIKPEKVIDNYKGECPGADDDYIDYSVKTVHGF